MAKKFASYSSLSITLIGRIRECLYLYRIYSKDAANRVSSVIRRLHVMENLVEQKTGLRLRNIKMLEIGPGQLYMAGAYFSCWNDVTGIDLDAVPVGFSPLAYAKLFFTSDFTRIAKTIARKLLRVDKKLFLELKRQIKTPLKCDRIKMIRGDAKKMPFEKNSFDFVYSFTVMEHIADPGMAIDEAVRVLKPGGVIYFTIHLYTSESGCHDPRIFFKQRSQIPYWAHLRPQHTSSIHPNAYLNELSLAQWKQILSTKLPHANLEYSMCDNTFFKSKLKELQKKGELLQFTSEELLTEQIAVLWQKPNLESKKYAFTQRTL